VVGARVQCACTGRQVDGFMALPGAARGGVLRQYDQGTRRFNQLRRDDLDARFPGLLDLVLAQGRRVEVPVSAP
jgi:hypothetical protein